MTILDSALAYQKRGISCFPIRNKKPCVPWKEYQTRLPTVDELTDWFYMATRVNIAIVTGYSGIVVVDCDSEDAEKAWRRHTSLRDTVEVVTVRGRQFYYNRKKILDHVPNRQGVWLSGVHHPDIDFRGHGGYVVAPPSMRDGHRYVFEGSSAMEAWDQSWLGIPPEREKALNPPTYDPEHAANMAERYISHIESVQGSNGGNACYRAAAVLIERGLNVTQAMDIMLRWNETNATPPWSEAELLQKVEYAYDRSH